MDIEVEFLDMIRQSGHTPGVACVRAADDKADSKVAAQLGIPTGTPILRISRLCTADGRPAIYCCLLYTSLSGLAIAALCGVILNAILPGNDYEFGISVDGDKSADLGSY